jgi:hypothetical protein
VDVGESLRRITNAVHDRLPRLTPVQRDVLTDGLAVIRSGRTVAWRTFEIALLATGAELDPWDVAMVGSSSIDNDVPGGSKVLINPERQSWSRT